MRLTPIQIDFIDRENFLRFGETIQVLRPDPGRAQRGEDEYRTLTRISSVGWRISMHCVRERWTDTLNSYDGRRLLSPREGAVLLCVAPPERVENVQIFVLDCAVAINAHVPHKLIALSAQAWVEVTENFETTTHQHKLRKALVPAGLWH